VGAAVVFCAADGHAANEDDFLRPVGRPPVAAPQRRQGGEALPPLPLPATPLRRSEKKRPPSPATLIGKVVWGSYLDYTWDDGQVTRVYDWNMVPADCQQVLRAAREHLGLEYKAETTNLQTFNATPAEMPVLHFSGGRSLKFSDRDRETLRKYLLAGGTVWFDSVVGSPYFYKSALEELGHILPESPPRRIPPDHPVFHMIQDAVKVSTRTESDVPPVLEGVYIGSRLAAVVSPFGLGVGWDNASPHLIPDANFYDAKSSYLLGLNLVAYAVGYFRVGQSHARADTYRAEDLVDNPDALVFAQLRTNGVWNTEPGAAGNLLRYLDRNLQVKASYLKKAVTAGRDPLDAYAFLYLSGITDFQFSPEERAALRDYVLKGGYLLVDNSLGLSEFDRAARGELARIFGDDCLTRVPADHPVFTAGPYPMAAANYTLAVRARNPDLKTPWLEGVRIQDEYRVFYSPMDLAAGWQGDDHPLACGYAPGDALQMGANLVTFFMTH